MTGTYRAALAVGEFRAVAVGLAVSILGDSAAFLAVTVLMYARTGSSLLAALTFVCAFAPYLAGGTLFAGLVDRIEPRVMMAGCDLVAAALVATIAISGVPVWVIFVVLIAIGVMSPLRAGSSHALVARILPGDAFVPGRSVLRLAAQGAQILGAALGGALIGPLGPQGALVADTASYLVSATLALLFVRTKLVGRERAQGGVVRDSFGGIREVLALRKVRRLLLLYWFIAFVVVSPEALAAPAVAHAGYSSGMTGVWLATIPLGFVLGDLYAVRFVAQTTLVRVIVPVALVGPIALVLFVLSPPLPVSLILLFVTGVSALHGLGLDRSLRDETPERLHTRMYSLFSTGSMAIQGAGFAVAGALGQVMTPMHAMASMGGLGIAAVAVIARL